MSRLTRDGTAEPVSRDQILRRERGQGIFVFPVQLTTCRIGNLTRLIHTLAICVTIQGSLLLYMHICVTTAGRGWSRDARTEAELQAATDAMHTAWQRLRVDTRDAQLRRAVRKACNWLKRVRSAAVVRFFERHVVELEK